MKKLKYIPVVLLLVLFSCMSSEHKENTRIYSIMGRVVDTVIIPEYVTIYPDSDNCYRPYRIDIEFIKPYSRTLTFRCGSFYVSLHSDKSPSFELQDFVLLFPNQLKDSCSMRIYNEVIKNNLYSSGSDIFIRGEYIHTIFMHGSKYPPYELWKK